MYACAAHTHTHTCTSTHSNVQYGAFEEWLNLSIHKRTAHPHSEDFTEESREALMKPCGDSSLSETSNPIPPHYWRLDGTAGGVFFKPTSHLGVKSVGMLSSMQNGVIKMFPLFLFSVIDLLVPTLNLFLSESSNQFSFHLKPNFQPCVWITWILDLITWIWKPVMILPYLFSFYR